MAIYPRGVWDPIPENATQGSINPTQVILHTAVDAPGPSNLPGYFARSDVSVESHFWVALDGKVTQMVNTTTRADANLGANSRAISIETEDEGDPEKNPWTEGQLAALIDIILWCHETHNIPLTLCPTHTSPGIGYHSMWGYSDPVNLTGSILSNPWTNAHGKTCPGRTRISQILDVVLPGVQGTQGEALEDAWQTDVATATGNRYNWAVALWQERLGVWGFPTTVDGLVGPNTEAQHIAWTQANSVSSMARPNAFQWRKLLQDPSANEEQTTTEAPEPTEATGVFEEAEWYKIISTATGNVVSAAVILWQERLNAWGYPTEVDGLRGPATEQAHREWAYGHLVNTTSVETSPKNPGVGQWNKLLGEVTPPINKVEESSVPKEEVPSETTLASRIVELEAELAEATRANVSMIEDIAAAIKTLQG